MKYIFNLVLSGLESSLVDILNENWKNFTYQLDCVTFYLLPLLLSYKGISA